MLVRFTLTDGAVVGTTTFDKKGDAGNFVLSVEQLNVRNGSLVKTETVGEGNGGNLIIKDAKFIEVIGKSFDGSVASSIAGASFGTGNAGNLNITTDRLVVREGGEITTATIINGAGGKIDINTGYSTIK